MFLNSDGTVKSSQKIAHNTGGFGALVDGDFFGLAVAALGDVDNDGIQDVAVGAILDDTGGTNRGAVYVLFLNSNGTVKSSQKIAHNTGGFGALADSDLFGVGVAGLGDLDNDGIEDLAAGVYLDDTGGPDRGAVHILFLNSDGTVKSSQKIAHNTGGFGALADGDSFSVVARLGDVDNDGIEDLAVGADHDDTGGPNRGAAYVLLLNSDGTVKSSQKIAHNTGGFGALADGDFFGYLGAVGDLDGDGIADLGVGSYFDDTGGADRGAVHLLFLNGDGTVKASQKIAHNTGGFGALANSDAFGAAVAGMGDLNGDGVIDLAVGASRDDTGGADRGAVYILFGTPPFLVTNTNDSSIGSLRQAILNANATPGVDVITFAIPGVGPHTIQPASPLPTITDPVVVDATSQPGYSGAPLIELDGINAGASASGLIITAGNSTVKGLAINRFGGVGLYLTTNGGNTIESNYIGTDPAGAIDLGNGTGLNVNNSPNNTIGGTDPSKRNLISGNQSGLRIGGALATGNTVQGNYIGTNAAGNAAIGNFDGVTIGTPGSVFGGTGPGEGNLVSGNTHHGLDLVSGVVVQGNLIGTNAAGTAAVGNTLTGVNMGNASNNTIGGTAPGARNIISGNGTGVNIGGASATGNTVLGNYIGTDITGIAAVGNGDGVGIQGAATGNTIGGTTAAARNLISGNNSDGLQIFSGATNNEILGNYIGIDATGTSALSNVGSGVYLLGAPGNIIGGTASGAGNVLSGNGQGGVTIHLISGSNNVVQGNLIGTDATGTTTLANDFGVGILDGSNNAIGGTAPGAGNIISGNTTTGVSLLHASGGGPIDNPIRNNLIYDNGGLGIDLRGALTGPDPNDPDDVDTGANKQQNYPVLTGAFSGSIRITGTLDSAPSTTFDLEFFANGACDASGFGEGEILLGSTTVATDANGDVSFDVTLPPSIAVGDYVTATATDPSGNTSEFSQCIQVIEGGIDVSIPDVQSSYATTVQIPVEVTDTSGKGVVSTEVFICYDGDLLTPLSADLTGTLAAVDWSIETNIEEGGQIDTYKIAMATDDAVLVGAGDLVKVNFQVANVRVPSFSDLVLKHVLFNDGTPINTAIDGSLTIIGTDGTITSLPTTIVPRETITITVVDADADLDGTPGTNTVDVTVVNTDNGDAVNLTLNEDGGAAGTFSGTVDTEFGTGAIVDALIQAQANDAIVSTYSDALDANGNGPTNRTTQTDIIGGADGSIAITLVSQPGDPLYLQVTDADLNTNDTSAETTSVTVENSRTLESFTVVLTEVDLDDDVFFGSLPTTSGASTATDMNTAEEDLVTATYDDVVTLVGDQQDRTASDDVIDPWGDADDNEQLQAFDAAQVLLDVLSSATHLTDLQRRSANVDIDPVASGINPYDASLILQKRVGLITTFEVQDPASTNHPQGNPASPKLAPEQRSLSLLVGDGYLSVFADERGDLLAGDIALKGISGRVEMGAELSSYLSVSRPTDQGIHIVFAGVKSGVGPGELLRVYGAATSAIKLTDAVFNNGEITGTASGPTTLIAPTTFALHPNVPNPFNPETTIRFELPHAVEVKLEVFDILGQKVRTLVSGHMESGTHAAIWDGQNETGAQVGNGVYLYRIQANEFTQMRRMLLLK